MGVDVSALLSAMATPGSGVTAESAVRQLIAGMDAADPRVQLVTTMLARRDAESERAVDDGADDDANVGAADADFAEVRRLAAEAQARAERAVRAEELLRGLVDEMSTELEVLRRRNDALAAALGACYLCWGADHECVVCAGTGRPGSARPEPHLFARLIAPAVAASNAVLGADGSRARQATAGGRGAARRGGRDGSKNGVVGEARQES